jgi:hypothetical protein
MIKITNFLLCIFLLISHLCAQTNYREGYVLNNVGEKIKGFIDDRLWIVNPRQITFKKTLTQAKNTFYGVHDIQEFGFKTAENKEVVFVSRPCQIDISPYKIGELDHSVESIWMQDTFFLSLCMRGQRLSLLSLNDDKRKLHFFVEREEGQVEELVNKMYYADASKKQVILHERFRRQLAKEMYDCNDILKNDLGEITYKVESLLYVFKKYNKFCNSRIAKNAYASAADANIVYDENSNHVELNLLTGLSMARPVFYLNNTKTSDDFSYSYMPTFGVSLNLLIPKTEQQLFFYNELMYRGYHSSCSATNDVGTEKIYNFDYIRWNALMRYRYPKNGIFKLFTNAGFGLGVLAAHQTSIKDTHTGITQSPWHPSYRSTEESFLFGAGVNYKKWSVELRYDMAFGPVDNNRIKAGFLIVGYQLY